MRDMTENIKCYLSIGFRDAALIIKNDYLSSKRNPTYTKSSMYKSDISVYEEPDLVHPIGVSQLTNALHVMCGLPPVPLKRRDETFFTLNDELIKMAENSYIRYEDLPFVRISNTIKNKSGDTTTYYTYMGEMFHSHKAHHNSNVQASTFIDGIKYNGYYNWEIFHSYFRNKLDVEWEKLINFFSTVLKIDNVIRKYSYCDFVTEFHKHLSDPNVVDFITNDYQELKNIKVKDNLHCCSHYTLGGCNHLRIIFGEGNTSNDHTTHSHYPLFVRSGVDYLKLKYSGDIIIPIFNLKVLEQMENVGITPNILVGGLVTIIGLQKSIPESILSDGYAKITEQNMLQTLEIQ